MITLEQRNAILKEAEGLWYKTLPAEVRESLFAEMRRQGEKADRCFAAAQKLAPPFGQIAMGGGAFEMILRAEVISSYLRILRKGGTPQDALNKTMEERTKYVIAWNKLRGADYVVHRAESAEQSLIEDLHRTIVRCVRTATYEPIWDMS